MTVVERSLALHAYGDGFVKGARQSHNGKSGRHGVDSATHEHWKMGYDAGRRALAEAIGKYKLKLELG